MEDSETIDNVDPSHLRAFIERIERMEGEKSAVSEDIKEIYAEAKGSGFDTKIMRKIIRRRKMDRDALSEEDCLMDLYLSALDEKEE